MEKALVGKKIGMTEFFKEDGALVPVTVCELGPCVVVQKKTVEKDGYLALKVGYSDTREKTLTKPIAEDLKKKNITPKKVLKEIDAFDENLEVGQIITCSIFSENDSVEVTGVSKGKGFAGTMKRYGFGGGRATHGSGFHRAPGSSGAHTFPAEIWKGKKFPGRLGSKATTVKNLKIVKIIPDKNLVLISGSIPGKNNSIVIVRQKAK